MVINSQKGQTTVEYILMLLVVVTMTISVGKRIKLLMFGTGDCPNQSLICKIQGVFEGPGYLSGSYRYYTLKR